MDEILGALGIFTHRYFFRSRCSIIRVFCKFKWRTVDLLFHCEFYFDDSRHSLNRLCKISSLSKRTILYIWNQVCARTFGQTLQMGLAVIFIRHDFVALFVFVEISKIFSAPLRLCGSICLCRTVFLN
jgi:hypothetical protein